MKNRNFIRTILFLCFICMIGFTACAGCEEDDDDDDNDDNDAADDDAADDDATDDDATDDDDAVDTCDLQIDVCEWYASLGCTDIILDVPSCMNTFTKVEIQCSDWGAALECFCDCRDQGLTCKDYLTCVEVGCIVSHCP